jgi:hypothetical protein
MCGYGSIFLVHCIRHIFIAVIVRFRCVRHITVCPVFYFSLFLTKKESKGKIEHAFYFLPILKG